MRGFTEIYHEDLPRIYREDLSRIYLRLRIYLEDLPRIYRGFTLRIYRGFTLRIYRGFIEDLPSNIYENNAATCKQRFLIFEVPRVAKIMNFQVPNLI